MFQPAPSPRFSASTRVTSGKRSRTTAGVPSAEPLSTTIVGTLRTLARQRSIQGSASYVTTTTATSAGVPAAASASAMLDARTCPRADPLPEHDRAARRGEEQGDEE